MAGGLDAWQGCGVLGAPQAIINVRLAGIGGAQNAQGSRLQGMD